MAQNTASVPGEESQHDELVRTIREAAAAGDAPALRALIDDEHPADIGAATASAPLVTTMADAAGVFIYFAVAAAILIPILAVICGLFPTLYI